MYNVEVQIAVCGMIRTFMRKTRGFTLIELLVVIAIIGILAAITLGFLGSAREKGRDASRASQLAEFVKAAELYYSDHGVYPDDGTGASADIVPIGDATGFLSTDEGFLGRIPDDPSYAAAEGYLYCSSEDGDSITILAHLESGAGDYCWVSRGPDFRASYCGAGNLAALPAPNDCTDRF